MDVATTTWTTDDNPGPQLRRVKRDELDRLLGSAAHCPPTALGRLRDIPKLGDGIVFGYVSAIRDGPTQVHGFLCWVVDDLEKLDMAGMMTRLQYGYFPLDALLRAGRVLAEGRFFLERLDLVLIAVALHCLDYLVDRKYRLLGDPEKLSHTTRRPYCSSLHRTTSVEPCFTCKRRSRQY